MTGFSLSLVGELDLPGDWSVLTTDSALNVTGCNHWLERHAGRSAQSFLGRPLFDVFPDLVTRKFDRHYSKALQGQTTVLSQRLHGYVLPLPSGDPHYEFMQQTVRIMPLREHGVVCGTVTVIEDVTERVVQEDELRAARDDLERRVAERTGALADGVERLREEIGRREDAEAARTELQRRLASAQEDERKRIARDLHDTVGQLMIGLSLAAKAGRIEEVQRISHELVRQVQELTTRLRPTQLDDFGLETATEQLVAEWSNRTGIEADFDSEGLATVRLPKEAETALYRVVQESLTNVAKHAKASRASVVLSYTGRSAMAIVEDDGAGFDPETAGKGRLGLVGMQERVRLAGGELQVESSPGAGTTIIARIPIREQDSL